MMMIIIIIIIVGINKNNDNNYINNNNSKNCLIWMLVNDLQWGCFDVTGYRKKYNNNNSNCL